ncbi:MAG: hypothetical protein LBG80_02840 [Bacteroidales bacterium]|nr:hypothetical protein [Bacteroidales bacterium]
MQKISEKDNFPTETRAELEDKLGVQSFLWINANEITDRKCTCLLKNRRVPNGTHGGVRGRNGNYSRFSYSIY